MALGLCLLRSKTIPTSRVGAVAAHETHNLGQERRIRSGTENTPAIIAFATMLQKVQKRKKSEVQRLKQMRNDIIATLSQIDNVQVNGDIVKRLPNNINVTIAGADGERLVMELDEAGLMVASGSACSARNDQPSHVLLALGHTNTEAVVKETAKKMRSRG